MQTHDSYTTDDDTASNSSASRAPSIDPEDPMRDYLLSKRKEEKMKKSKKSKSKHKDETPEERRERKQRKKEKKVQKVLSKSAAVKDVEALLSTLRERNEDTRPRRSSPDRYRKRPRSSSPVRDRGVPRSRPRHQSPSDREYDWRDKDEQGPMYGYDAKSRYYD
jgi:RNA-binding motif X-linked protein 2